MKQETFRPQLTPFFVAQSLGLTLPGITKTTSSLENSEAFRGFRSVTTDSRKVEPGCLFVAIRGEKFDGHDFIAQAVEMGARGIICRRDYPLKLATAAKLFPVEDTEAAYRRLSAAWRREFSIPVIAVAGSVGKTTTKELLAAILRGKWPKVLKTQGSQNGYIGIPMTLLEIRPEHGAAVIEVGIDEIGAMEKHMQIVGATAGMLTAIGPEHLEKLRDIPTVAHEEGLSLAAIAGTGGLVAVNLDDPWIRPHASILRGGSKVCYTLKNTALPATKSGCTDKDVLKGRLSEDGKSLSFAGLGLDSLVLELPLLGNHNASNLLGAVALARGIGLTPEEIQAGLKTFRGADGRSEIRELGRDTQVLCDYYNANPSSVEAGLDLLSQLTRKPGSSGTRWLCLGDMLELGKDEEKLHRELAKKIRTLNLENVLLYGERMRWLFDELKNQGFAASLQHSLSHQELAEAMVARVKPGDVVMIKGSRGMRMEEVWKLLESYAKTHWRDAGSSTPPSGAADSGTPESETPDSGAQDSGASTSGPDAPPAL